MVKKKFRAFWCIICLCSWIRSYLPPKNIDRKPWPYCDVICRLSSLFNILAFDLSAMQVCNPQEIHQAHSQYPTHSRVSLAPSFTWLRTHFLYYDESTPCPVRNKVYPTYAFLGRCLLQTIISLFWLTTGHDEVKSRCRGLLHCYLPDSTSKSAARLRFSIRSTPPPGKVLRWKFCKPKTLVIFFKNVCNY